MRKSSLDVSVSENTIDTNALKLSEMLAQTILTELQSKFPSTNIGTYSYRIIDILPQTLQDDLLGVAGKVQVEFNARSYFIELTKIYYNLEKKLGNTPEGRGVWDKLLHRLKNPSPKNRRGKAREAISSVAKRVASSLSRNGLNKNAN